MRLADAIITQQPSLAMDSLMRRAEADLRRRMQAFQVNPPADLRPILLQLPKLVEERDMDAHPPMMVRDPAKLMHALQSTSQAVQEGVLDSHQLDHVSCHLKIFHMKT